MTIAANTKHIAESLLEQDLLLISGKLSYLASCTFQYRQKLSNLAEGLLDILAYELSTIIDSHLCCGSAATYSFFQPVIPRLLTDNKLNSPKRSQPDLIVNSNIGCQIPLTKNTKLSD